MTVEIHPHGARCNLSCSYCYERPMREVDNVPEFNLFRVLDALEKVNCEFTIFGGEPLLLNMHDLETLFHYGFRKFKQNGVQTNGTLITDEHVKMFRKYNVHVGFSIDGPGKLNAARGETSKSLIALDNCLEAGLRCSLITIVHKLNALGRRETLKGWLEHLKERGLVSVNLHWLQHSPLVLGEEEAEAWLSLYSWSKNPMAPPVSKFNEMRAMLVDPEKAQACCLWKGCDPYTTSGVYGIDGDGTLSNCGRVNTDGVNWPKANTEGKERDFALYHTPQEYGGCRDCRFFLACKGECPGNAIDQDWRNRSGFCDTLKLLFMKMEDEVENPVSKRKNRKELEERYLRAPQHGSANRPHGDHTDMRNRWHANVAHGNTSHVNVRVAEVRR